MQRFRLETVYRNVSNEMYIEATISYNREVRINVVTGTPRPKMKWTKNGAELFDGGSLDLHQSAEVCVLHIINVRRSDAAEYEMQLSNDSGTETVPITVKVVGKCFIKYMIFNIIE